MSFQIPRKESPNRAPAKRDVPFPEPSNYLLKFPVNRLPRFPNGLLWRETSVSRTFFYTFPSKSPVNELPSMFPNRVPMERKASSPEPMVYSFIHLYLSASPVWSPPTKKGENIWSLFTEPQVNGRPTYNGVRPGFPKGSLTTLQSLPQCHAAFCTIPSTLAWVDHSTVSQRVVATLIRVCPPQLLPPPT